MAVSDVIIDLSGYCNSNSYNTNSYNTNLGDSTYVEVVNTPMIESLIDCATVDVEYLPGAPQLPLQPCPTIKYSGDTVTLKATPRNGIAPYIVTFKKDDEAINSSRLGGSNPISPAPEDVDITRAYILDDLDISSALSGTIKFSVEISDSCPTGPVTCTSECIINIGCMAPVCNFVVT
jgi:hypothetical protein